jgi:hypothetical protein
VDLAVGEYVNGLCELGVCIDNGVFSYKIKANELGDWAYFEYAKQAD